MAETDPARFLEEAECKKEGKVNPWTNGYSRNATNRTNFVICSPSAARPDGAAGDGGARAVHGNRQGRLWTRRRGGISHSDAFVPCSNELRLYLSSSSVEFL